MKSLQTKINDSFKKGSAAGKKNQPSNTNPHKHFGPLRKAWLTGWEENYPSFSLFK